MGCDDAKAACHLCVRNLLAEGSGNTQRGYKTCISGCLSEVSPDQLCWLTSLGLPSNCSSRGEHLELKLCGHKVGTIPHQALCRKFANPVYAILSVNQGRGDRAGPGAFRRGLKWESTPSACSELWCVCVNSGEKPEGVSMPSSLDASIKAEVMDTGMSLAH